MNWSILFQNSKTMSYQIFGNSLADYLVFLVAFVVFLFAFGFFQKIILKRFEELAKKTKTDIDDVFVQIIKKVKPPFYSFLAFWLSLKFLKLHPFLSKIIDAILIVWVVYLVIEAISILIDYWVKKSSDKEERKTTASLIGKITKWTLWALGFILVLSNLGVNVSSLIAGLGIGGIALALAVQNILTDLFSSFAIYFDKPFKEGDFIVVGQEMGTVEKIGLKTTRVHSLQGEEIVISNRELTSATIHNYKKMRERRIVFHFGVVYETPSEKLEKIPSIVEEVVNSIDLARLDRVHFYQFGDSALMFEVVYYVKMPDYNTYMDVNQKIHLGIKKEFEKEEIEMAYPTQTIYLKK